MAIPCFPEEYKILMPAITAAANAVVYDVISCKNLHKVWFIIQHCGATDVDLTLQLYEATDVAAATNAIVTATFPIWVDTSVSVTSDTLVRQTDAAVYTIDVGAGGDDQLVIIEWDPAKHTAGYDCIYIVDGATAAGSASNTVTVLAIGATRYQQDTPPTAILN